MDPSYQQAMIKALINSAYQPGMNNGSDMEYGKSMAMNPMPTDPRLAQAATIPVNPGDLTNVMQHYMSGTPTGPDFQGDANTYLGDPRMSKSMVGNGFGSHIYQNASPYMGMTMGQDRDRTPLVEGNMSLRQTPMMPQPGANIR